MPSTNQILRELTKELVQHNIAVTVKPAVTTSSLYIVLDHGAIGQMRIGDHRGKGYNFSFEIGDHIPEATTVSVEWGTRTVVRKLFPGDAVDALVEAILAKREDKIALYGQQWYDHFVEERSGV